MEEGRSEIVSSNSKPRKSFCFVGRYSPVKGLDILAAAYRIYSSQVESPWELVTAGKGECREQLVSAGAEDRGFIQPEALPAFFADASAFILPSRFEPWGVVIQEAAASGLPLVCSNACGAGVHLLRDGFNGISVPAGDTDSLVNAMVRMTEMEESKRNEWGKASFELSKQYTPERWVETMISGVTR